MDLLMKKFNTVIYIGLIINCLVIASVWYIVDLMNSQWRLSYDERQLLDVLNWVHYPFMAAIAAQIASLFILDSHPKIGLTIAIISSIVMVPLSLIFLTGYLYAYENRINRSLTEFTGSQANLYIFFKKTQLETLAILYLFIGGIVSFLGLGIGWVLCVVGIVTLCNLRRLKNRILIGADHNNLILTPNLHSKTYLVPLNCVTVLKDNDNLFKLHIITSELNRKITHRKAMLMGNDSSTILNHILAQIPKKESQLSNSTSH
ncbi:hypothetical protein GKR75_18710 [Providencia sp. wls1919]|nr:hypothetical protein [Providencia sp. wls1919]